LKLCTPEVYTPFQILNTPLATCVHWSIATYTKISITYVVQTLNAHFGARLPMFNKYTYLRISLLKIRFFAAFILAMNEVSDVSCLARSFRPTRCTPDNYLAILQQEHP